VACDDDHSDQLNFVLLLVGTEELSVRLGFWFANPERAKPPVAQKSVEDCP
jgi:hypothetical protein